MTTKFLSLLPFIYLILHIPLPGEAKNRCLQTTKQIVKKTKVKRPKLKNNPAPWLIASSRGIFEGRKLEGQNEERAIGELASYLLKENGHSWEAMVLMNQASLPWLNGLRLSNRSFEALSSVNPMSSKNLGLTMAGELQKMYPRLEWLKDVTRDSFELPGEVLEAYTNWVNAIWFKAAHEISMNYWEVTGDTVAFFWGPVVGPAMGQGAKVFGKGLSQAWFDMMGARDPEQMLFKATKDMIRLNYKIIEKSMKAALSDEGPFMAFGTLAEKSALGSNPFSPKSLMNRMNEEGGAWDAQPEIVRMFFDAFGPLSKKFGVFSHPNMPLFVRPENDQIAINENYSHRYIKEILDPNWDIEGLKSTEYLDPSFFSSNTLKPGESFTYRIFSDREQMITSSVAPHKDGTNFRQEILDVEGNVIEYGENKNTARLIKFGVDRGKYMVRVTNISEIEAGYTYLSRESGVSYNHPMHEKGRYLWGELLYPRMLMYKALLGLDGHLSAVGSLGALGSKGLRRHKKHGYWYKRTRSGKIKIQRYVDLNGKYNDLIVDD